MKKPNYWQESIDFLKNNDKKLAKIIKKYNKSVLIGSDNSLETLIRSVVGQQISVKAAASVWQKMVNLIGKLSADNIFSVNKEKLKSCGLSHQKTQYILNIANHYKIHHIDDEFYWNDREFSNIYDELISIKGIGPWLRQRHHRDLAQRRPGLPCYRRRSKWSQSPERQGQDVWIGSARTG